MVHNPITALITRVLWDFEAVAQVHIQPFPTLEGVPYAELPFHFPDGIVVGTSGPALRYLHFIVDGGGEE